IYFALHQRRLFTAHGIGRGISPIHQRVTTMLLSHLVDMYRQWRRYNESLRELNRLADRELADIGMTRGDIPRVAWESSER
ncbi:DUF1127 domain-containing protein, partial [Serratia marcescens]|uniref:DUF1127 domain-containing protein n=1 Tax=Serratia marcescens TaxID=615 RepID=UPI0019541EEE